MATPSLIEHLETVGSTQDEARARYSGDPVVVTASRQTGGRGRSGSRWENADRALAVSMAFHPDWPEPTLGRLTLVAGLAAHSLLPVGLKWPNDLLVGDRKVGGILTERSEGVVVVGMGVNLWWSQPPEGMGGVHDEDPGPAAGPLLGERWATDLLVRVSAGPATWGRDQYQAACVTIGDRVTWQPEGAGTAIAVDDDGRLLVRTDDQRLVAIASGSVSSIRREDR